MVTGFFDVRYVRRCELLRRNKNRMPAFPVNPLTFMVKHSFDVSSDNSVWKLNPSRFKIIFISLRYLFTRSR